MAKKRTPTATKNSNIEIARLVVDMLGKQTATSKADAKVTKWTTLVESGKGKRISLAPQDAKYESRGVVVSRFAKSIFIPANQFSEFVADVEKAEASLKKLGMTTTI